jgi:hypothetical protein
MVVQRVARPDGVVWQESDRDLARVRLPGCGTAAWLGVHDREKSGERKRGREPKEPLHDVRSPASMGKPLPLPSFSVVRERHESGNGKLGFG